MRYKLRRVLRRTLREAAGSIALALSPLAMCLLTAWLPPRGVGEVLRVVPSSGVALYLPVLTWNVVRSAQGRPPRGPLVRHWAKLIAMSQLDARFAVVLTGLPALLLLALGAPVPGILLVILVALPLVCITLSVALKTLLRWGSPGGLVEDDLAIYFGWPNSMQP